MLKGARTEAPLVQPKQSMARRHRRGLHSILWRDQKPPAPTRTGLTTIALLEPTLSSVVGSAIVAVGAVQEGIRNSTLYTADKKCEAKSFRQTLEELQNIEK